MDEGREVWTGVTTRSRRSAGGSTAEHRPADGLAPKQRAAGRPAGARRVADRPRSAASRTDRVAPTRVPSTRPVRRRRRLAVRLRATTVLLSALTLALTGTAWGLYRDVTSGINTTGIIAGGWGGGDQNILLVGVDSRTDAHGRPLPASVLDQLHSGPDTGVVNSDTIMVLHVPSDGGAAVAFSIPRDAYVDIPGYRRDKINAAYPAKKAEVAERLVAAGQADPALVDTESAEAGRQALVGAVQQLTGLSIDHYAELNLAGFYNLTAAIGGVEVCLKGAVDDPLSGARLAAGPQIVTGADALAFVRQRHGLPDGDLSRIRRQQVFLAAVADKILSSRTLTDPVRLSDLVDAVQASLVIDSDWDLLAFAQQASDIAAGNLRFLTIPTRGPETNARGDVMLVDQGEVQAFIERTVAEQQAALEAARDAPKPPPPLSGVIAERYVVDVRNASDAVGLAGAVADHARDLGFVRGTVDNSAPVEESVVRYTGSDGDAAEALAVQLGDIGVQDDDEITPGHLMVMLGSDFDPGPVPGLSREPAPAVAPDPGNITAAGVPCVD